MQVCMYVCVSVCLYEDVSVHSVKLYGLCVYAGVCMCACIYVCTLVCDVFVCVCACTGVSACTVSGVFEKKMIVCVVYVFLVGLFM